MSQPPPEWQPPRPDDPLPPISGAPGQPAHASGRREWWPFVVFAGIALLVLAFVLLVIALSR